LVNYNFNHTKLILLFIDVIHFNTIQELYIIIYKLYFYFYLGKDTLKMNKYLSHIKYKKYKKYLFKKKGKISMLR